MKCFNFAQEARDRILIEEDSQTTDDYGGVTTSWTEIATVWAKVTPTSEHTRFISQNVQTRVTHKFIIRYRSGLADVKTTVKHRITLDTRLYDIIGIKNVDEGLKNYGKAYQILLANEAGPDV